MESGSVRKSAGKRNVSLDLIKVLAAFGVVCIHYMFSGEAGIIVKAVARFAVPFFFVVSGFFAYRDDCSRMLLKALHIAKLYLYCFLLYFVYGAAREMLTGRAVGIAEYIGMYVSGETISNFLLRNTTISAAHLWFLPALVYCYLIFYVFKKIKLADNVLMIISVSLLAVRLVAGEILGFANIVLDSEFFPNFIFIGVPFFTLGMFIDKYRSSLDKISNAALLLMLVAGVLETILSVHFSMPNTVYLGTPLIVFVFMVLALKYGDRKYSKVITAVSQLSTYIYVFHVCIGGTMETIVSRITPWGDSLLWVNIKPFVVLALSMALSWAFKAGMDFLRGKMNRAEKRSAA